MNKLAFIGGTGVYNVGILHNIEEKSINTPYGKAHYQKGLYENKEIIFLARHGVKHTIPPHKINYRANIYALKMLNVSSVISTTAVGSMNPTYKPGELVLINQFIDCTKHREHTFFDGERYGVTHIDMSEPYCNKLRRAILKAGIENDISIHPSGTYICTEGPRFETAAEIKAYQLWGADVVGMTNVPECSLAREAEICYATISMVTNFSTGINQKMLSHKEVFDCMEKNIHSFRKIVTWIIKNYNVQLDCTCHHALDEFGGFHL